MAKKDAMSELGVSGDRYKLGLYGSDEFLPQLRGNKAIKAFREMRDNDAIVGAIITAMTMMLRSVEWRVEAVDDSQEAENEKLFVESLFDDMSHTFEDFISEVLTFLIFGFSFFEEVYKVRNGRDQRDPAKRSKYNDGRIGIRKLAPRAQWTLDRWEIDDDGGVKAFVQSANGATISIPIEKGLLFRTATTNNDPSGKSILRNVYKSWYYQKHIQSIEAIAIERELNGLPVARVPSEYLSSNANSDQQAFINALKQILRDVKINEQGYVILPSDLYLDSEGNPTSQRQVEFELVSASGTRAIDTGSVIVRYQQDMARSALADFLMLGQAEKGSFALSKSKTDLFLMALQGYLDSIAAVLNRFLLPKVWKLNGLNYDLMPSFVPGEVAPVDIAELGDYIQKLASAGAPLFPDEDTENVLRATAGLPEKSTDAEMLGQTG